MKTVLAVLLAAGALLLGAAPARVGATTRFVPMGIVPHQGHLSVKAATATRTSTPTCGTSGCSAYENGVNQFFTDVAAASHTTSNVYSVANQYSDSTGSIAYASSFGGSYVDTTAYPTTGTCKDGGDTYCLTDPQLQTEIANDIAANGWPDGGTTNLFFILTPSDVGICIDAAGLSGQGCSTNVFCAYHDDFSNGGHQVVYAVEPDNATIPGGGCDSGQHPNNADVDPSLNTISHEMIEAITDPLPEVSPGWWSNDTGQPEIGDLCAWTFGVPLGGTPVANNEYNQVINGHDYWLQEEYSNQDRVAVADGCVQHIGGTPSAPALSGDGKGPLVYQGGSVMRTNTVYVIYWIPSPASVPTISTPPVVSGVAGVGKTLSTTNGVWSGSPTSFAYQWQQCSATGTGCADIAGANASTYTLASGDAGHEIRSEVSARNTGGSSAFAAATPTEVVVPVPAATVAPAVSGVAAVGKTLSTTQGTWNTPVSYAYQWLRCSASGTGCASIAHATSSAYTLKSADRGHELEARVAATNAAGTTLATSAATAVVVGRPAAKRLPRISGTAKVGQRLSVSPGAWTDGPSFSYRWLRCNASGGACKLIAGATRASYKLTKKDAGHKLRVQEIAANIAGRSTASSAATRTVKS